MAVLESVQCAGVRLKVIFCKELTWVAKALAISPAAEMIHVTTWIVFCQVVALTTSLGALLASA